MITIRMAGPEDVPGIRQCVNNAYKHYIKRLGKPPGPMLDDYADTVSQHLVYVGETGSKIAGVVVLMETYSPILLDNLAVDPNHQGSGLGNRLLLQAENVAHDRGHTSIQLYTHELMHENLDYYDKHGYQISHRISEKGYQRIYMCKDI